MAFDVTELPDTDHVAAGEQAPDFERPLVDREFWEDATLSDLLADAPVLLVFHTMDGDFPATYVWQELDDRDWEDEYGVQLVGLSISTPYEHSRFLEEHDLDYPLFSDPANGVAEEYGIVHDLDGMAGLSEPRISTFLIDGDRTVRHAWVSEEWPEFPDYDELESALEEL
ncbi:peroxiredoxin [Halobacteriales archaeon QS_1_68_20]|nr:MAG: peroxiredoxin [Halobacteriales archaeon QS_1_68_20]